MLNNKEMQQDAAMALAKKQLIAQKTADLLVEQGIITAEQKDIVVTGLLAGSEEMESKVKQKQILTNTGYNASLGTTLAIMGAIIAIIAIYSWVTGEQKK
jgi:hypothetical protein